MVAALMLGRRSLASVDALRGSMSRLHAGHARRIEGQFPSEVQPLVDDLNGLSSIASAPFNAPLPRPVIWRTG